MSDHRETLKAILKEIAKNHPDLLEPYLTTPSTPSGNDVYGIHKVVRQLIEEHNLDLRRIEDQEMRVRWLQGVFYNYVILDTQQISGQMVREVVQTELQTWVKTRLADCHTLMERGGP